MALALTITQMGCQAPPPTSRITVASAGRISSLDPAQASTLGATQLISALGDPLYRLKRDGSLEPRLAASAPVLSDGGRTVTVPLRTDVRFHDGTPFNAAAMAFSLRRFLEIGTLSYVVGDRIAAVEEADSHTLRLRLSRPSTSLQGLLTSINLTPIFTNGLQQPSGPFSARPLCGDRPLQTDPLQRTSATLGALCPVLG